MSLYRGSLRSVCTSYDEDDDIFVYLLFSCDYVE